MRRLALVTTLASLACVPEEGPLMQPGRNCMECHGGSGEDDARPWTLAGTVYAAPNAPHQAGVEGVRVHVTDSKGFDFRLRSNQAGNFYTAEALSFPLAVCLERDGAGTTCMESPVEHGSCNACHTVPPTENAPGRLTQP